MLQIGVRRPINEILMMLIKLLRYFKNQNFDVVDEIRKEARTEDRNSRSISSSISKFIH